MLEKELWTELSLEVFTTKLAEFTDKFGKPKIKKRLGLEANDFKLTDLDTRIRITNGEPVIVQKVGNWVSEYLQREEVEVNLVKDPVEILKCYKVLLNQLHSDTPSLTIIQNENYYFYTSEFEIKLVHQFGGGDVYICEIEALTENADLLLFAKEINIEPDLTVKDEIFWKEFNKKVNLSGKNFSDQQLLELIERYFKV